MTKTRTETRTRHCSPIQQTKHKILYFHNIVDKGDLRSKKRERESFKTDGSTNYETNVSMHNKGELWQCTMNGTLKQSSSDFRATNRYVIER